MDYYFPGKGKSGDLAPRKGFADKWHKRTLALAPNIELHILVGSYAQRYYLHQNPQLSLRIPSNTIKTICQNFSHWYTHRHEITFGSARIHGLKKKSSQTFKSVSKLFQKIGIKNSPSSGEFSYFPRQNCVKSFVINSSGAASPVTSPRISQQRVKSI